MTKLKDGVISYFRKIYREDYRKYHNTSHILGMISELKTQKNRLKLDEEEYSVLYDAIWFHDLVYIVGAGEGINELCSARMVESFGLPEDYSKRVQACVMATSLHFKPNATDNMTREEMLIMDLDLLSFTYEYKDFKIQNKRVSEELIDSGVYTEQEVNEGRLKFLKNAVNNIKFHVIDDAEYFTLKAKYNIKKMIDETEKEFKNV